MMIKPPAWGRLEPHPSQIIDRSKVIAFEFDGWPIKASEGDTIGSALHAAGVKTLSRSFKYHRARGMLCVAGRCPNCLMTVDGVPNVRVCTELVRNGIQVRHQNAWPSLDYDFLSILDRFDRLLPVGFYYKTFHRPKLFWRFVEPIIRRVAGLGSVDVNKVSDSRYHHESRYADVAVVGGGPAGMSAALAASSAGAGVVLLDDQSSLGGHLRFDARIHPNVPEVPKSTGYEIAATLAESVRSAEGIEVWSRANTFGFYEGNLLGVLRDNRMTRLRAQRIVVATGSYEVPLIFDRNDLPGVMLSTGLQRLIHLYGVKPGSTALVATCDDQGYYAALDLLQAGVRVAALVDSRPGFPGDLDAAVALQSRGVLVLPSHMPIRAEGRSKVLGGVVARLEDGRSTTDEREFDCDIISVSGGFQEANALLQQARGKNGYDPSAGETVHQQPTSIVHAAGEVTGSQDVRMSMLQGRLEGLEAAMSLGMSQATTQRSLIELRREMESSEALNRDESKAAATLVEPGRGSKRFVCFCEDVTVKDIAHAIDEGFEDVEILKRYTTVTMGPCQGKMCLKAFTAIRARCARDGQMGVTTLRPPVQPVPLGALAGPSHMPIKRTSIDRRHREVGAQMMELGPWQRPHSYGSPQDECMAVRQRVGIIDVSTLGKLDVRGRDAALLLDKLYTHRFTDLGVGRIRYAMLCADNGAILDDGTVTRLADDHYFVTTTTGNVELIEEWFKWWLAGTGMCAHVTNVTSAFAAINVAGPKARDTLSKLTEVDLSTGAFRYMMSVRGSVAGVRTLFLRIGFVGEAGWELHFPAEYGEHMWDALMDAGSEFSISPFGVEAQRILRLEKGHLIVNQDTDAVSNPLESGMEWVVQFEKEDFIGRGGLVAVKERGLQNKLVGFVMRDGLVPQDGAPVLSGGTPVGRVTSSRLSPTLDKGFGFAWVPADMAEEGKEILIRIDGKAVPADVTLQSVYDPEGKRLRE